MQYESQTRQRCLEVEEEEDLDPEQGVGWGRKNSYETYIRSSCNAACRVGMGAVQWRYWREREMTDPCNDGFGWCDQCEYRGSGHMGERVCS